MTIQQIPLELRVQIFEYNGVLSPNISRVSKQFYSAYQKVLENAWASLKRNQPNSLLAVKMVLIETADSQKNYSFYFKELHRSMQQELHQSIDGRNDLTKIRANYFGKIEQQRFIDMETAYQTIRLENLEKMKKRIVLSSTEHMEISTVLEQVNHDNFLNLLLSHTTLSLLPPEISQFKNTTSLFLMENNLSTIPIELCELTELVHLAAAHNQIETIPEEFKELKKLRHLNLNHNQLRTIPSAIAELPELISLDLQHNPLEILPENFGKIFNRTSLYLTMDKQQLLRFHDQLDQMIKDNTPLEDTICNFCEIIFDFIEKIVYFMFCLCYCYGNSSKKQKKSNDHQYSFKQIQAINNDRIESITISLFEYRKTKKYTVNFKTLNARDD